MVWKRGDAQTSEVYRGHTYRFASADEREKFLRTPEKFRPVLSGADPYLFVTKGVRTAGKREFGVMFNERVVLFATAESRDEFRWNPQRYLRAERQIDGR
jgi:YHS domain-containing protein